MGAVSSTAKSKVCMAISLRMSDWHWETATGPRKSQVARGGIDEFSVAARWLASSDSMVGIARLNGRHRPRWCWGVLQSSLLGGIIAADKLPKKRN